MADNRTFGNSHFTQLKIIYRYRNKHVQRTKSKTIRNKLNVWDQYLVPQYPKYIINRKGNHWFQY